MAKPVPMPEYHTSIIAQKSDMDMFGHVNNAVWVQWIQEVATRHWNSATSAEMQARWLWMVVRHEIDYHANIGEGEEAKAHTWVEDPPKGALFERHMSFHNAAGKKLLTSLSRWVLIDQKRMRPARVPQEIIALFLG